MPITGKICPDVDKLKEMKASGLQVAVTCDNTALLWIVGAEGTTGTPVLAQFLGNRPLPWPRTCVGPMGCQSLLIVNPSPSAPPAWAPPGVQGGAPCQGWGCPQCPMGVPHGPQLPGHHPAIFPGVPN